jgi:hypothetical protein
MSTLTIHLTSSKADADILVTALHGLDGIGRIERAPESAPLDTGAEEISDEIPGDIHAIVVEVPDRVLAAQVRELASDAARLLNASIEFVYEA